MHTHILQRSMLCLGLVAYLFTFVLRADGIVLCIGEDGHVELEVAAQNMRCGLGSPLQDAGVLQAAIQDALDAGHCGECKDIPLVFADLDEIANESVPATIGQASTIENQLLTATHLRSYLLPDLDTWQEIPAVSADLYFLAPIRSAILLI